MMIKYDFVLLKKTSYTLVSGYNAVAVSKTCFGCRVLFLKCVLQQLSLETDESKTFWYRYTPIFNRHNKVIIFLALSVPLPQCNWKISRQNIKHILAFSRIVAFLFSSLNNFEKDAGCWSKYWQCF